MDGASVRKASTTTVADKSRDTWPHELSHEPALRIGELRERLLREFPMLSCSKIRHFEDKDLLRPHRAVSNQRFYSEADVERLRFILRQQRDRFLPLDQIRDLLMQLDDGERLEDITSGRMRVVSDSEIRRPQPGTRLTTSEVADLTGASIRDIEALIDVGVLSTDPRGRLTSQGPEIVLFAQALQRAGFDVRQIRAIAISARSHAVSISQRVATERAKKTPVASERALSRAGEAAAVTARLYKALLAENLEVELR